ncbi:MAG: hypothetical protein LBQ57_04040 [Spirochaetales bacterium]|jgi:hypothetical protein|nr:hypothetical protein [Spirochaetales bacterium]
MKNKKLADPAILPTMGELNTIITDNVSKLLGPKLDGRFIAVNYPAGFNYGIQHGVNAYYNAATLATLDSVLGVYVDADTGTRLPVLEDERFSTLYDSIIKSSIYKFSNADQDLMNKEDEAAQAQVSNICGAFKDAGYDIPDNPDGGKIAYIIAKIKEVTGTDYLHIDPILYPEFASTCAALGKYAEAAVQSLKLHTAFADATLRLKTASAAVKTPAKANGGLQTDTDAYYVGYSNLPATSDVIDSLNNDKSEISISINIENFSEQSSKLTIDNGVSFTVPVALIFEISVDHESHYDLSKFTEHDSSVSIDIKYPGITIVASNPLALSDDAAKGWYDLNIIQEIAQKSGNDATGYQLFGAEFDPQQLFGAGKQFAKLKTFVISRQPEIQMTLKEVDAATVESHFKTKNSVSVKLFDWITLGHHDNTYSVTNIQSDESEKTVTINLAPPAVSSSAPLGEQVAFVVGGVADYPGAAENSIKISAPEADIVLPLKHGSNTVSVPFLSDNSVGEFLLPYEYDENQKTIKLFAEDLESKDEPKAVLRSGKHKNLNAAVHRLNELITEKACAAGLTTLLRTNPPKLSAKDYTAEQIEIITSVWGGLMTLNPGADFANVIGSSLDPLIDNLPWIRLWEEIYGEAKDCTSHGYPQRVACSDTLIGGHLIPGREAKKIDWGSDQQVFIMPICASHNQRNATYMKALTNQCGIWLNNYHKK